jgi:hypothetical protein
MGGTPIFSFASSTEMALSALQSVGSLVFELSPIGVGVIGVVFGFAVLAMITGFFAGWFENKTQQKDEDDKSIPTIDYVEHRMRRADWKT